MSPVHDPVPDHLLSVRGRLLLFSDTDEAEFSARWTAAFPCLRFVEGVIVGTEGPDWPRWYRTTPEVPGYSVLIRYIRQESEIDFLSRRFRETGKRPLTYPCGSYRRFGRSPDHRPMPNTLVGQALNLNGRRGNAEDKAFMDRTFAIIRKFATNKLAWLNYRQETEGKRYPSTYLDVWAGPDAVRWCREDRARVMMDIRNYSYVPPDE